MEFRILGAPEVIRDGAPLAIRGRIAPRLLAVLALEAGHVVPISTLVEALWEDPPVTARRQVQNTVSALRAVLGERTVEAVAEGYRLAVPAETVDAGRFAAGVRRARQLREDGDPVAALERLREALALWRGHALAGMGGQVLERGARRLGEDRLAAFEERVELELELGQRVPVGELRQLLTENPYRQRLAALLMLALYREGRAPEALEVHTRMRQRLSRDLGVEPGPALRERYAAILREDPELDVTGTPAPASRGATRPEFAPAQLPAALAGFTGRTSQLRALDALGDDSVLATITGCGGSGKTALAVHWAHRNRDRFPDGQLYLNLRGFDADAPLSPQDALTRLLPALGQPADAVPAELDAAAALFRSLLTGRRMLLLLDNARDAAQVEPLLPNEPGTVTLVTSRHRLTELAAHGATAISLDTLDETDALALLSTLVPDDRLAEDPAATAELVSRCGGLPLALRIVGANLAGRPYSTVAEFAAEHSGSDRLGLLTVDGDPNATVATVFERSARALDEDTRRLFLRLGLIPGDEIPEDLSRGTADLSETVNRELLGRLESAHLIERHRPGLYRFHDLVRLYARQQAESTLDPAEAAEARTAAIDWYASSFEQVSADPGNVIAAFKAWQDHPDAWRLARMLPDFLRYGHSLAGLRPHVETGLALAKDSGDAGALSQMYDAMAFVHSNSGDHLTALTCGRKAVAIARGLPDGDADGRLRSGLAALLLFNSYYEESAALSRETLAIAEADGDIGRIFHDRIFLGAAYRSSGRFADAETCFVQAMRLADTCDDDDPRRVTARFKLARLYNDMDRVEAAWPLLEAIGQWWQRTGSDFIRERVLWLRGQLQLRSGRVEAAEQDLADSWELSHRNGILVWAWYARFAQIELCCQLGDHERGLAYVEELAESGADTFERDDRAQWAALSAKVHIGLGDYRAAIAAAEQARTVFTVTKNPLRLARCLVTLAEAHERLGDTETAERHRDEARRGFAALGLSEKATRIGMSTG
ncbi:AfsR/SARP family transcriptional regulator [Stackebrandtia nassauensis]|uniref:Transcriptional regulator, SARP family n=1 Tax=Stackebrandtia nassauensis (strain DSM 44728 / CIP 108903 / NRRL B-16338 / NBRC 102104 / LLR-40K-21) TaxID=446470 RepID=D3Q804_STANL|nr:AfsR/SARP family transcriptional regulator [Stackebrandtia nassauensis]ADD40509.1 transcriptional regulator, SARP family [Stackebrandtia nassauensis DSM 44728]